MSLTEKLSPIELLDWRGKPVRLGSLWKQQTVVLAFIRHFG